MGNVYRNDRRHTITPQSTTPYSKHQVQNSQSISQQQITNGNIINKNNNNLVPTNNKHPHLRSQSLGIPPKMVRAASSPSHIFSDHHKLTQATKDNKGSTPNQHLIKPVSSSLNAAKQKKKPKRQTNLFTFNKQKHKHFRIQSVSIPYVHFNDNFQSKSKSKSKNKRRKSEKTFMSIKKNKNKNKKNKKKNSKNHSYNFPRSPFSSSDTSSSVKVHNHNNGFNSDPSDIIKRHQIRHKYHSKSNCSDDIDDDNKNKRKLLLLGNGSCGKSTIFKQLKLILRGNIDDDNGTGFDDNELTEATHAIRQNCVSVLLILLHKCGALYDMDNIYFNKCSIAVGDNNNINKSIEYVMKYKSESFEKCTDDLSILGYHITFLWNLSSVQYTYSYRHKRFTVPDNMHYFYNNINTIFSDNYIPSCDDILRLRIRTTGMIENKYSILHSGSASTGICEYSLSIFDTGGERNERKKWIHTFENVDIVIFVAALSHYCCVLWEDEKTISMHDAIELFQEICNGKWFKRSEMILCLNKDDLFRSLLFDEISLNVSFSDNIKYQNYNVKLNGNNDITPPPSPSKSQLKRVGVAIGVPQLRNAFNFSSDSMDNNNDNNDNDDDDEKKIDNPFPKINQWIGAKWNGPNFKYDSNKTKEENNKYFEKCYDCAIEFIVSLFLSQNKDPNKTIYVHITNALDQTCINNTFQQIKPLIIKSNHAKHCQQFF